MKTRALGFLRTAGVRRALFASLDLVGLHRLLLRRIQGSDGLVVLNLHQVSPTPNPFTGALTPRLFDELLAFVTRHFTVTTFARLDSGEFRATKAARSPLVLSFDDGYYNFVEYAMPLLAKYGVAANQNVIGEAVLRGRAPWNVDLADFLNACPPSLLRDVRVPGFARPAPRDEAEKMAYGVAFSRYLKQRPRAERAPLVDDVLRLAAKLDYPRTRMMSLDDVREASREHEIGSHSFSHESMGYESLAFFRDDLDRALRFHADAIGSPTGVYAFPNGSYRDEQVEALFARGVRHALLVDEAVAHDLRRVPRLTFYARSPAEVRLQAVAWRSQVKRMATPFWRAPGAA